MPTTLDRPMEVTMPGIRDLPDLLGETSRVWERDPLYAVFLHNDEINTMEWVLAVLQKVFGYTEEKCMILMLTAHFEERCSVWEGALEIAELHAERIIAEGPDPSREADGAKPLRVTIERIDAA